MFKIFLLCMLMGAALSSNAASDDQKEALFEANTVGIMAHYGGGRHYFTTGLLIDSGYVITLASSFYDQNTSASFVSIFNRKIIGTSHHFFSFSPTYDDVGLILLEAPVDLERNIDPYILSSGKRLIDQTIKVPAYVLEATGKNRFSVVDSVLKDISKEEIIYEASDEKRYGSAGASLFLWEDGDYRLCGIHREMNEGGEAIAIRLTQEKINWIYSVLSEPMSEL